MKLVSTLPDRPGFLHAVPILDLFALLLVALLLGQSFMSQAGVQVELPVSPYQISRAADATVISLTPGNPPVVWIDREQVPEDELARELSERRQKSAGIPTIYLRCDTSVDAGEERKVAELALQAGFRVYLLGRTDPK